MADSQRERSRVGVIGDLVASRAAPLRRELQRDLEDALRTANELVTSVDELTVTIGDEFQGLYNTIDEAVAACLVVQLKLGHESVRFGIGSGTLSVYDRLRVPYSQDGPVWWAAREAINELERRTSPIRTVFVDSRSSSSVRGRSFGRSRLPTSEGRTYWEQLQLPGLDDGARPPRKTIYFDMNSLINALLIARDGLVARLDEKDRAIALGLIRGRTQAAMGEELKMSQSAVSQRIARAGTEALVESFRMLGGAVA